MNTRPSSITAKEAIELRAKLKELQGKVVKEGDPRKKGIMNVEIASIVDRLKFAPPG